MTALADAVRAWDGKSAADIAALHRAHAADPGLRDAVIAMIGDPAAEAGATWLLKRDLETGAAADAALADRVYGVLDRVSDWQARLHLLQCVPLLPIADARHAAVAAFARGGLDHANKFVRAWAYGAMVHLARQHPQYAEECDRLIAHALRAEAPSVKARLRKLGWQT